MCKWRHLRCGSRSARFGEVTLVGDGSVVIRTRREDDDEDSPSCVNRMALCIVWRDELAVPTGEGEELRVEAFVADASPSAGSAWELLLLDEEGDFLVSHALTRDDHHAVCGWGDFPISSMRLGRRGSADSALALRLSAYARSAAWEVDGRTLHRMDLPYSRAPATLRVGFGHRRGGGGGASVVVRSVTALITSTPAREAGGRGDEDVMALLRRLSGLVEAGSPSRCGRRSPTSVERGGDASEASEAKVEERIECRVCFEDGDEGERVGFFPCGHVGVCKTCAEGMPACPFCRSPIEHRAIMRWV
jgi:hypothetical protein